MKPALVSCAIFALTACGGAGGSVSTTANAFEVPTSTMMAANSVHTTSNSTFGPMLNEVRADNGANPVTYDARLGAAAQGHANDMLANSFFSHRGSNGSTVGERATAQQYNWNLIGENIGRGQSDEAEILQGWVDSPDHQANNIDPRFEDFGLARAGSGNNQYWVLVLGREF